MRLSTSHNSFYCYIRTVTAQRLAIIINTASILMQLVKHQQKLPNKTSEAQKQFRRNNTPVHQTQQHRPQSDSFSTHNEHNHTFTYS